MDKLNIDDPDVQQLLSSDFINEKYPLTHLPKKLVDPTTEKGKSCQYKEIDSNIYEEEARMIAFRTNVDRIQPWLKTLHIFYLKFYVNQPDKKISWLDNPQTLTHGQQLKSVTIDVKQPNDKLLYKITFFIKTGLIQCQGNNHEHFVNNDFPQLITIMTKLAGPISDTPTQNITSDLNHVEISEAQTRQISSDTSVKSLIDSESKSKQNVDTKLNKHRTVECQTDNAMAENFTENMKRLQLGVTDTISKLEGINSSNTKTILNAISECDKAIKAIPGTIKQQMKLIPSESEQPSDLKNKIKLLQEDKNTLESQLKSERGNMIILQASFDNAIKHEQELLAESRNQLKLMVSTNTNELEYTSKRLDEKNEEIKELTSELQITRNKLQDAQDEILQLKLQISASMDTDVQITKTHKTEEAKASTQSKPQLVLVGTSNIQGINEEKLTMAADVHKIIKYTLDETSEYIKALTHTPDVIVFHSLTNDLKSLTPQQCIERLYKIVSEATSKWPMVKCVISFTTPRKDSMAHFTNAQIINALLKQKFSGIDNIFLADHSNMLVNGNPNHSLLREDKYHLNEKGISQLASNIKRAVHTALGVPLPPPRQRSRSRQRRGQGRGRGRDSS